MANSAQLHAKNLFTLNAKPPIKKSTVRYMLIAIPSGGTSLYNIKAL
jgi:hypothetical protein